jgi:hypothetical protein
MLITLMPKKKPQRFETSEVFATYKTFLDDYNVDRYFLITSGGMHFRRSYSGMHFSNSYSGMPFRRSSSGIPLNLSSTGNDSIKGIVYSW